MQRHMDKQMTTQSPPVHPSLLPARSHESTRRDKPQLSCGLCRQRKLRCDRQRPCHSCWRRGLGDSCTYPLHSSAAITTAAPASGLQDRLLRLENAVQNLANVAPPAVPSHYEQVTAPTAGTTTNVHSPSPPEHGSLQISNSTPSYVDSAHWTAVLDGIAELKEYFRRDEPPAAPSERASSATAASVVGVGPQLLLSGGSTLASKDEILDAIPDRPVVDRLVSKYFNSFDMSPAVLHSGQFLDEYENFWTHRQETPIIWLGLLFTIMSLAAQFQSFDQDQGQDHQIWQSPRDIYRQKSVQCLILGNYLAGGTYVLETLILYFTGEHYLCKDAEPTLWILSGTIIQLAMHMGYHRDPKHFNVMPLLAAEMQRRIWATIVELDLAMSAQMGLPRLIKTWHADIEEPRNLRDSDLSKATTSLPDARPETELTPMLYRIVKYRYTETLGAIADLVADVRPYAYDEVMNIDARLNKVHIAVPQCLEWRSLSQCIADPPHIMLQKVFLDAIYHKAKIVLHRRFVVPLILDQYSYSRKECVDAALSILEHQHMLGEETQPYGSLYNERWKISSIVNQDFLLATSVLCFYMCHCYTSGNQEPRDLAAVPSIRAALRRSYEFWMYVYHERRSSTTSKEAHKAARAIDIVLHHCNTTSPMSHTGPAMFLDTSPALSFEDFLSNEWLVDPFLEPAPPRPPT